MPRGNDPAALSRLADEYGSNAGNADALIQANASRFSREMRAAGLLPVNKEATEALDVSKLAAAIDADGGQIISHAVRGEYATAVLESADGVIWKTAVPLENAQKGKKFKPSVESALDAETVKLNAEAQAAAKVAAAELKADEIVAEAQAKAAKVVQDEIAKAAEEARKVAQKAFKEAAAATAGAPVVETVAPVAEVADEEPAEKPAKPRRRPAKSSE